MKRAFLVLAVLIALPYARSPLYRFPAPVSFSGNHFFNPYENLGGTWQRANLHAHGRAWSGLTNGEQPDEVVAKAYQDRGYSVAGISDYQRIARLDGASAIPLYEHGYNVSKRHQLAIGAHDVEWFDFPLWQSTSQEQLIIDLVKKKAELVALAHPTARDAYSADNLHELSGYQLIEVANGPFASEEPWDTALSSGHAVWGLANDDNHDVADFRRLAAAWNMIDAPSASARDVIEALRQGRFYAAQRVDDATGGPTTLAKVTFSDKTLTVVVEGEPALFAFVGQNGDVRHHVKDAMTASYTFDSSDTYIRTVIRSPASVMYLNPVLRYDGQHIPAPVASVDVAGTWLMRATVLAACAVLVALARKRRPLVAPAPRPVISGADQKPA